MLSVLLVMLFIVGSAVENRWFATRISYHTHVMRGEDLRTGSPVLLSGIEVGEIGDLKIMYDNRIDVELLILEKHAGRMKVGTKASVRRLLGIGEKRIHLISPTKGTPKLPPGALVTADEPMDILDAVATMDLDRYLNTMDRAVSSMEVLLSKLEEDNRMERIVEAFDELGPTMQKVNNLLGEIGKPMAALIKDPSLRRTFQGADKVFNDRHTRKMLHNMAASFDPKKVTSLIESLDKAADGLNTMVDEEGSLSKTVDGMNKLMNDGRLDRMLTSMERLTDAEKLEKLIDNMAVIAKQMAKIGPEIPTMSKELITTMRELAIVLKALQKTWLLDDESEEVIKKMRRQN